MSSEINIMSLQDATGMRMVGTTSGQYEEVTGDRFIDLYNNEVPYQRWWTFKPMGIDRIVHSPKSFSGSLVYFLVVRPIECTSSHWPIDFTLSDFYMDYYINPPPGQTGSEAERHLLSHA